MRIHEIMSREQTVVWSDNLQAWQVKLTGEFAGEYLDRVLWVRYVGVRACSGAHSLVDDDGKDMLLFQHEEDAVRAERTFLAAVNAAKPQTITEAPDPYLPIARATWRYMKRNPDDYNYIESWSDLYGQYKRLMAELRAGIEIYRGLSWDNPKDVYFDVRDHHDFDEYGPLQRDSEEAQAILANISAIDFTNAGVCWTDDWSSAVSGGAKDIDGACHCILTAKVSIEQVDVPRTIFWRFAKHPEEWEIRLHPDTQIAITAITPTPDGVQFPIQANTGKPHSDQNYIDYAWMMKDVEGRR